MTRFYDTLSFQLKYSRIERLKQHWISHQANVSAISFKRKSDAIITRCLAKVFLTAALHAKVTKIIDKHDTLLRYAVAFSKHFREIPNYKDVRGFWRSRIQCTRLLVSFSRQVYSQSLPVRARDGHWTGVGLDWIRTMTNYVVFGLEPDYKSLQNLGSGPDLDWINGKEMGHFCCENAAFFEFFGLQLDLDFSFEKSFGVWLDLD